VAETVVWQPTPRQSEFLACADFEALYGGAAGGGKSDALLIDALCLQHGGLGNPNHRAIVFRRSYPELADLIDRSRDLYSQVESVAGYNRQDKVWSFASGAKVGFGYLQHDNDRFKYRGRAWNYIGFDELTLWPTPVCYLYLHSRCRTVDASLPRYIRAATNPDGPGQKWVMERFGISPDGKATRLPIDIEDPERSTTTTIHRRFIPARLDDNPYLADTGYRETLLQLPPEERDALLRGLWTSQRIKGAYYAAEMAQLRQEGRIRAVSYTPGVPVNTFWDLGWNDTTAIWFHQFIAGEHRFLHAYENSGEALDHYASYIQSRGYVYDRHYLPHDAANTSLQTGKTNLAVMQALLPGQRFEVVGRIDDVLIGINDTRMAMRAGIYIDAEGCADGIAALDNYRKRYVERLDAYADEPLHDRYSNYADAFRQWGQGYRAASDVSARRGRRNRSAMAV
jgi:hypothetical protein